MQYNSYKYHTVQYSFGQYSIEHYQTEIVGKVIIVERDNSRSSKFNSKTNNTTIRFARSGTNTSHGFSGSHSKYKQSLGKGPGKASKPQDTLEVSCLKAPQYKGSFGQKR